MDNSTLLNNDSSEKTYILGCVQVLDVVDVNVAEQNQTLDVLRMVFDQLVEERCRFQWPMIVRQQQGEIEEGAAEVVLEMDGAPEPVLRFLGVPVVHGQHAEIEVDALVVFYICAIGQGEELLKWVW